MHLLYGNEEENSMPCRHRIPDSTALSSNKKRRSADNRKDDDYTNTARRIKQLQQLQPESEF